MNNKTDNKAVNDSYRPLDSEGVCDSLVEDLNNLLKNMAAGQYIRVSSLTLEMVQKLHNLKNGIKAERKNLEDQNEDLRRLNNELAEKAFGAPANKENETTAEE